MTRGKRSVTAVQNASVTASQEIQQSLPGEGGTGKRRKRATSTRKSAAVASNTEQLPEVMVKDAIPKALEPAKKVPPKRAKKPKAAAEEPGLAVSDGKCRCEWSTLYVGSTGKEYVQYHDEEWGVPHVTDEKLFEHLTLDASQAGLSWSTILAKRAAYTRSFKQWDIAAVAAMTEEDVEALLKPESGIVRHRGKIQATINNARCVLEVQKEFGSLAVYLWSFVPGSRPVLNSWKALKDAPTTSQEAEYMSKCLKKRGFKFVGPTMCYAMMQAVGMINDHTTSCFRYKEVQQLASALEWPFPATNVGK